jgi:hypothetical protein
MKHRERKIVKVPTGKARSVDGEDQREVLIRVIESPEPGTSGTRTFSDTKEWWPAERAIALSK